MPLSLLLLAMLAPAQAEPITVTGHNWAPFISPMGEPFRAHSVTDDTLADWFQKADLNHDGVLTEAEMVADAERFFATLDTDHDGEIDPDELAHYEWEIAPDIQVMSRTQRVAGQAAPRSRPGDSDDNPEHRRGRWKEGGEVDSSLGIGDTLQGAARYSLLNIPEPVAAADTDFNRSITLEEFKAAAIARFQLLDTAHQGRIALAQLEALPHAPSADNRRKKRNDNADDSRIGNPLPSGP